MNGSGYRGRGFGPRGVRGNSWNGGPFGGPRFRHPNFTPPRPPGNRPVLIDTWVERPPRAPFQHWQQNRVRQFQNFSQPNTQFCNNNAVVPPFHPNNRGRILNLRGGRGFFGSTKPSAPPFTGHNVNFRPKEPLIQNDNTSEESTFQVLLGSEKERQQKIEETANRLKQKLSSVSKEDMINFWEDDFSILKPTFNNESSSIKLIPERKNTPDLDLTFNDFKDIGRVNPDSSKKLSVMNKNFDEECILDNCDDKGIDESVNKVSVALESIDIPDNAKELSDNSEYPNLDYHNTVRNSQEIQELTNSNITKTLFAQDQEPAKSSTSTICKSPCTENLSNNVVVTKSNETVNSKSSQIVDTNSSNNTCKEQENVSLVSYSPKNQIQLNSTVDSDDVQLLSSTCNPCTSPLTFVPKSKVHDKVLPFCSQKPALNYFSQQEQLQPPPVFDPRLSLQEKSTLFAQASTDVLRPNSGASNAVDSTIDFNKPGIISNLSQLSPMVQPLTFSSSLQISYPPSLPFPPQPQMLPHMYSIPPPPIVQSPVFHQERSSVSSSLSNEIQQSEINEGLKDMHNAMKFAQEIMNVANDGEKISECSNSELPLSDSDINTISLPKIKENKSQKPQTNITCDSNVYLKKIDKKEESESEKLPRENDSTKQNSTENDKMQLKSDRRRGKVAFNFHTKTKKIVSHRWQKKYDKIDTKSETKLNLSNSKAKILPLTKTAVHKESRDMKHYLNHRTESEIKDKIENGETNNAESAKKGIVGNDANRSQKNRVEDEDGYNVLQDKLTSNNCRSNSNSSITQKLHNNNRQIKKICDPLSEISWKNKVINRFLKMSKSDICNMVNNSSLRKFDIVMNRLVKEKRSSLSLKMRNTEDEKIKNYDRDEFMSQLNAMLNPGAVVDVGNLPAEFIHHLSEVLQLEPEDWNQPVLEPDVTILDSKVINRTDMSDVITIDNENKQITQKSAELNAPYKTNQLYQNRQKEANLEQFNDFVKDLVLDEHDTLSLQKMQQNPTSKKHTSMFNIADLDDIFSEVIAKVNDDQMVDSKKINPRTDNMRDPLIERPNNDDTPKNTSSELTVDALKSTGDFEKMFSIEFTKVAPSDSNEETRMQQDMSLSRLSQIGIQKWNNREQDDSVAFRNLTKEEWEARYGVVVSTSSVSSSENDNNKEQYSRLNTQENKAHHSFFKTCSSVSPKYRSDINIEILNLTKNISELKSTSTNEQSDLLVDKNVTRSLEKNSDIDGSSNDSCSNSSNDSFSDSSSSTRDRTTLDITKLLKVIKEKEKIAKTRSFSETMRDEITAEIERTRLEKKKHKEKKFRKRSKKRRDRKEKRRKSKKRCQKKSVETNTSNCDNLEMEQQPKLLTENEIKKEIIIKEEKNSFYKQNRVKDNVENKNDQQSLSSKYNNPPFLESVDSGVKNDLISTQISEKSALVLPTLQLRTKAQLKQMPESSKNEEQIPLIEEKTKNSASEDIMAKIEGNTTQEISEEKDLSTENYYVNQFLKAQEEIPAEIKNDQDIITEKVTDFHQNLYKNIKNSSSKEKLNNITNNILEENDTHILPKESKQKVKDFPHEDKKMVEQEMCTAKSVKKLDIKMYKERMLQRKSIKQERIAKNSKPPSLITENLLNIPLKTIQQEVSSNASQNLNKNANNDVQSMVNITVDGLSCEESTIKIAPKQNIEIEVKSLNVPQQENLPHTKRFDEEIKDSITDKQLSLNYTETEKPIVQIVQFKPLKMVELEITSKSSTNKLKVNTENNTNDIGEVVNQISEPSKTIICTTSDFNKFKNIRSEGSKELKLKKENAQKIEKKELIKKRPNSENCIEDKLNLADKAKKQNILINIAEAKIDQSSNFEECNNISKVAETFVKNSFENTNTIMFQKSDKIVIDNTELQEQSISIEKKLVTDKTIHENDKFNEIQDKPNLQENTNNNTIMMERVSSTTKTGYNTNCNEIYYSVLTEDINDNIKVTENLISDPTDKEYSMENNSIIQKINTNFESENLEKDIPSSARQSQEMKNKDGLKDTLNNPSLLDSPESIDSPFKGFPQESASCMCNNQPILENIHTELEELNDVEINHTSEIYNETNSLSSNGVFMKISLDSNISVSHDHSEKNVKNSSQQILPVSSTEIVSHSNEVSIYNKETDSLSQQGNENKKSDKCLKINVEKEEKSKEINELIEKENYSQSNEPFEIIIPTVASDSGEFTSNNIVNTSSYEQNINKSNKTEKTNIHIRKESELNRQDNSFMTLDSESLCVNDPSKNDESFQANIIENTEKNFKKLKSAEEVDPSKTENESSKFVHLKNLDESSIKISSNETNLNSNTLVFNNNTNKETSINDQALQNSAIKNEQIKQVNNLLLDSKEISDKNVDNPNVIHNNKTKNTKLHGVTTKLRIKNKYNKKRNISQRNLEDAVKSDTVTLVSKETIISRMIQIDVEIHKLIMEKMALYKLLETKSILEEVSPDSSTVSDNKTEDVRPQTSIIMSQFVRNIQAVSVRNAQLPTCDNIETTSKKIPDHKNDYVNINKDEFLIKLGSAKRKRNLSSLGSSSEEEKIKKCTENKEKRPKLKKNITCRTGEEIEPNVATSNKKADKNDAIQLNLTKNALISKDERNLSTEEISREKRKETSVIVKDHGLNDSSFRLHENLIDNSDNVIQLNDKVLDFDNQQAKYSLTTSIYSDESTIELADQESSAKNNLKKKHTGLAKLEESFKQEIAISKKIKTIARKKKNKKLKNLLDSVNYLTPEEEELPLNKLYIKKLQQKKNLLVSLNNQNKAFNSTNVISEDYEKISEHVNEIIDAVAEDKIQELYNKSNKIQITDNNTDKITSTQVDDVSGLVLNMQESFNENLEKQDKEPTYAPSPTTFENISFSKLPFSTKVLDEKDKLTKSEESDSSSRDIVNTEAEMHSLDDNVTTTSQRRIETFTQLCISLNQNNQSFHKEDQPKMSDKCSLSKDTATISSNLTESLLDNTVNTNKKSLFISTSKHESSSNQECARNAAENHMINQNVSETVASKELRRLLDQESKEILTKDTQPDVWVESVPSSQIDETSEVLNTDSKTGSEQITSSYQMENSNLTSTSSKLVLSIPQEIPEDSLFTVKRKFSPLNVSNNNNNNNNKKVTILNEIASDESATETQQRSPKRKKQCTLMMKTCKVRLIDSKYTILKPDVNPNTLKQLGISTINNFNVKEVSVNEETPVAKLTQGKDSLEALSPLEKVVTAQKINNEAVSLHFTHDKSSKFISKSDSMVQNHVKQKTNQTRVTRTRKFQKTNNAPVTSHEIPIVNLGPTSTKNTEIKILDDGTVNNTEETMHDEESSIPHDLEIVGETKQARTQYTVHKGPILDIKVFDDSILAASEDGMIYRYNQSSNGILNIYKGHKAPVTCLYIHKMTAELKKEWMYSGALDGTLRCYDIMTGLEVKEATQIGSPIQCMDQAWGVIFIGTKSGHVSRFDIKSNNIRGDIIQFSDKSVLALKATNEGPRKVLIVASRNQAITIRDAQTGLFLRTICGQRSHTVYSLMRDNNFIYCGTSSTSIPVFDFTNGEQIVQYNAGVGIVCMRLYQQLLFAGCYDGNIYVFDTKTRKLICSIPGPGNMLLSMEIIHHRIIAGSKDKRLQSWLMPKQVQALLNKK